MSLGTKEAIDNQYVHKNTSFSGGDIVASITLPECVSDGKQINIGNLQTISYSVHREIEPVRSLGEVNPKGWTRGPRTVAGSMIFTIFDKNLVYKLQEKVLYKMAQAVAKKDSAVIDTLMRNDFAAFTIENLYSQKVTLDMMPPFDIYINAKNEYGKWARQMIYGVTVCDEGQVMSVEDIIIENTVTYKAMSLRPIYTLEGVV